MNRPILRTISLLAVVTIAAVLLSMAACTGGSGAGKPTIPTGTGTGTGTAPVTDVPSVPSNPNPADNATDVATSTSLSFSCTGADDYYVYFGTADPPQYREIAYSATLTSSLYTWLGNLSNTTTYYWQIIAENSFGNSSGPVWKFMTEGPLEMVWEEKTGAPDLMPRMFHQMAWDGSYVILHGGLLLNSSTNGFFEDTYAWNGTTWMDMTSTSGPNVRYGHAMCYDGRGAFLFGGRTLDINDNLVYMNDCWRFGSGAWSQLSTTGTPPSARSYSKIAWDQSRDVIVLYGGAAGTSNVYNDTWELNMSDLSWVKVIDQTFNGALQNPMVAFVGDNVFLYGGATQTGAINPSTLIWNSVLWTLRATPTYPDARTYCAIANLDNGDYAILHGGLAYPGGYGAADDKTWRFNGVWKEVTITSASKPSARLIHAMGYDPNRGEFVIYGGATIVGGSIYSTLADTWVLKKP
jgi:hypothetical protein